jgi:uncharacterized protein YjaG (DUF416 family)
VNYDEPYLIKILRTLPGYLRVAFAALCAERLLPAYVKFSKKTGRGDAAELAAILDWLWKGIEGTKIPPEELQARLDACMSLIPDEDEHWVTEPAYAEDAASAAAYALRAALSGESQEAAWAARCAYNALYYLVDNRSEIDPNKYGAQERVIADPLIQKELARQRQDLDRLVELAKTDGGRGKLAELRARAKANAYSFDD